MSVMTFVEGDDWMGIYIDGELVHEGHSIHYKAAVEIALDHDVKSLESKDADPGWLYDVGNLPEKLSDVKCAS